MPFIVKIPDNGTFTETKFNNVKEMAKFLEIGENTVYSILNGTCAFNRPCTAKLKDAIIYKEVKYKVELLNKNESEMSYDEKVIKIKSEILKLKEELKQLALNKKEIKTKELNKEFINSLKNV